MRPLRVVIVDGNLDTSTEQFGQRSVQRRHHKCYVSGRAGGGGVFDLDLRIADTEPGYTPGVYELAGPCFDLQQQRGLSMVLNGGFQGVLLVPCSAGDQYAQAAWDDVQRSLGGEKVIGEVFDPSKTAPRKAS